MDFVVCTFGGILTVHIMNLFRNVTPGGEAKVSLTADFFISSTQFYMFDETLPQPWEPFYPSK